MTVDEATIVLALWKLDDRDNTRFNLDQAIEQLREGASLTCNCSRCEATEVLYNAGKL